jgi:metal-dependent amidase/aminoacylase/carboxypeptidase family protein
LARELVGGQNVKEIDPELGSEDFSFYTQQSPGCYLILGVQAPGQPRRPLHNSEFDIDESVIPLGAAMMAQLAIKYLEDKPLIQHQELRI